MDEDTETVEGGWATSPWQDYERRRQALEAADSAVRAGVSGAHTVESFLQFAKKIEGYLKDGTV